MVILSYLLGTCSTPPSLLEQIVLSGEFRAVTRNSPVTFYYGQDEPRGISYELAKGFADRLGVDLRIYVAEEFWQIFPDVAGGNAHVGAAALTITQPREALVDFGPPYQQVQQQVIYRRGTRRPAGLADVIGGRLEVLAGSAYVAQLKQARQQLPLLTWVENPSVGIEELIRRVAAGEIDYTIADSHIFDLLRHSHPDARAAFNLGPTSSIAWALPKTADTSLRESVAAYFAELRATGELSRMLDRYYFYAADDFDYVGSRAFVRHFDSRLPEYKDHFIAAAEGTDLDWRLLAAMAYQESHWDPLAVSPTGVRGMMMLTQRTAQMMGVEDRTDPRESIRGGAEYFARVMKKVPTRIGEPDRSWLAVAAYNVGYGHLEDARIITEIQGGDPDSWQDVRERLPLLSDPHWYERLPRGYAPGIQPLHYVDNVRRYYDLLLWMTAGEMVSDEDPEEPAPVSAAPG
jgi:membrane-bound lytic murein transglycosylase F